MVTRFAQNQWPHALHALTVDAISCAARSSASLESEAMCGQLIDELLRMAREDEGHASAAALALQSCSTLACPFSGQQVRDIVQLVVDRLPAPSSADSDLSVCLLHAAAFSIRRFSTPHSILASDRVSRCCSPRAEADTISCLLQCITNTASVFQLSPSASLASAACCFSLLTHQTAHCKPHIPAFMNVFGRLIPLLSTVDVAPDMERVVYTGLTTCASLQPDLLDKCMRFVFDSHTSVRSNSGQARAVQASSASLLSPLTTAVCEVCLLFIFAFMPILMHSSHLIAQALLFSCFRAYSSSGGGRMPSLPRMRWSAQ
jgi:hypothetical protein